MPKDVPAATLAAAAGTRRIWISAGLTLALCGAFLCAIFPTEIEGAVRVWLESTAYNHCFLIPAVAAYLAWDRRETLAGLEPRPDLRVVLLLVPLAALWLIAATLSILEAQQFVLVAMFEVMALAIMGWRVYRAMLTPFLYLFLLVPSGGFLVPSLQDFTARFVVVGLRIVGIPTFSDGTFIEIPAGTFVVAEACAGLRFLVASVAFGILFATLTYRSWTRRAIFIALSVLVPIIANGFRAFGLLVLAELTGNTTAVMADHILYGWLFFSLVTFVQIGIGMTFTDGNQRAAAAPLIAAGAAKPLRPWRLGLVAVACLAVAASGPVYAQVRDWGVPHGQLADLRPPAAGSGWSEAMPSDVWKPHVIGADREFFEGFSGGGDTVLRYVALYRTSGFHNNLVRSGNRLADDDQWHVGGHGVARVAIGGTERTVAAAEIGNGMRRLLVWSFYVVNGQILASPMQAKLAQLRDLFGSGSPVAAYVVVATEESATAEHAKSVLQRFIEEMSSPTDYLERVAGSARR